MWQAHLEKAGLLQVLHVAGVHFVAGGLLHQRRPAVEQHRHLTVRQMTAPSACGLAASAPNNCECSRALRLWDGTADASVL